MAPNLALLTLTHALTGLAVESSAKPSRLRGLYYRFIRATGRRRS